MPRPSRRVPLAIVAAAILALVTGCTAPEPEPTPGDAAETRGITDETVLLGISSALSGPLADAGACTVAGLRAYLETGNAAGGFEFGDGLTRRVTLSVRDDAYDPATAQENFRELVDEGIFAYVGGLGTSTNAAIMPIADEQHIPQVLLLSGAALFSSDQETYPWTMGLIPSYRDEGRALGELLLGRGDLTVAVLAQDDGYGDDYLAGFREAIDGSDVRIVARASYDPEAATLDAHVGELAASGADVLLSAVSVSALQSGVLATAQTLGWRPEILLPSTTSSASSVVIPGGGAAYPAVYSTTFAKTPGDPQRAEDADLVAFAEAMAAHAADLAPTLTPQCAWSYTAGAVLEEAFARTAEPTRAAFLEALRSIEDLEAPLLLEGVTVDTTDPARPAIAGLQVVRFTGQGYAPVR